jgi:hypothetical protein
MSMIAHGYGLIQYGSPNLIFSNVVWGYFVRSLPTIHGILGYSLATLGIIALVGATLFYVLRVIGYSYVVSLPVLLFVLGRPVLFPQFTVNAGLLMIGAVACWYLYGLKGNWKPLFAGCALAWFSYLVRSQEALLVFVVALPFFPWRNLLLDRAPKIALLVLASSIALSAVIDHQSYQSTEWKAFSEINIARAPYTDFAAGALIRQRPDIYERYGYSANDITLLTDWSIYVDPKLADPKKLKAMLAELGPLPNQASSLRNAWDGVETFWHPNLLPIALAALMLFALRPSLRLALSWTLCIVAAFAMGLVGRPGALRVYVPLLFFLLIASLLYRQNSKWNSRLITGVILIASAFGTYNVIVQSRIFLEKESQIRTELIDFPDSPIVVWGGDFPFEATYPVLAVPVTAMNYHFYGLGVFAPAPFSVVSREQKEGRSMINLFLAEKGVPIIASERETHVLQIYCKERFHGDLKVQQTQQYGQILIRWLKCSV